MNGPPGSAEAVTRVLAEIVGGEAARSCVLRCDRAGSWTATTSTPCRVFSLSADRAGVAAREVVAADDDRLRLSRLLREPERLAQRLGWLDGSALRCEVLSYRPGARVVVRVTRSGDGPCVYLKGLRRRAFARAGVLRELRAPSRRLALALPTALWEDVHALLVPSAPGDSLHGHLVAGHQVDVRVIAEALRELAGIPCPSTLPRRSFADELASATKQLALGATWLPQLGDLAQRVARCQEVPLGCSDLVHGDLHDKQLFVSADRVACIDLEGVSLGDARVDAVNLAEHFALRAHQRGASDSSQAAELSLALRLDPEDRDLRCLRAIVRARLAGVYAMRPRWHALARELGESARALLEERC